MKKQILTCIFLGACASGFTAQALDKLYPDEDNDHDGFSMGGGRSTACSASVFSADGSSISARGFDEDEDDGDSVPSASVVPASHRSGSTARASHPATQVRISAHEIHAIRSRDTAPLTPTKKSALAGLILALGMEVGYSESELRAELCSGKSKKFEPNATVFANAKGISSLDPESFGKVRLFENAINMYLRNPIDFFSESAFGKSASGEYSSQAAGKKRRADKAAEYVAITERQYEDIQLRNLILQELKL